MTLSVMGVHFLASSPKHMLNIKQMCLEELLQTRIFNNPVGRKSHRLAEKSGKLCARDT